LTLRSFPSGAIAKLEMSWTETEPASFEVRVPRYLIIERPARRRPNRFHAEVAQGLQSSVEGLRAAGVKALVRFVPFEEVQPQRVAARLPWKLLAPEPGPFG